MGPKSHESHEFPVQKVMVEKIALNIIHYVLVAR